MVITSGHNPDGLQGEPPLAWSTIWLLMKVGWPSEPSAVRSPAASYQWAARRVESRLLWGVALTLGLFQRDSVRRRPSCLFAAGRRLGHADLVATDPGQCRIHNPAGRLHAAVRHTRRASPAARRRGAWSCSASSMCPGTTSKSK